MSCPWESAAGTCGHATIEMTMRYAHLSPELRRDAVKVLETPPAARAADER